MRCGTTFLHTYLLEHPKVMAPVRRQLWFFDMSFHRGIGWYRSRFPLKIQRVLRGRITGEATPDYLFHREVPGRVARVLPQVKLLVLLRNPVDRAYSHYWLEVRQGQETLSFEKAIEAEDLRLRHEGDDIFKGGSYHDSHHRRHSYLARGIYVDQLLTWMRHFPLERLLILKSEDLYQNAPKVYGQTLRFLGLPDWEPDHFEPRNAGEYSDMNPATRRHLTEYFSTHNERLYRLLGRNLGWEP